MGKFLFRTDIYKLSVYLGMGDEREEKKWSEILNITCLSQLVFYSRHLKTSPRFQVSESKSKYDIFYLFFNYNAGTCQMIS